MYLQNKKFSRKFEFTNSKIDVKYQVKNEEKSQRTHLPLVLKEGEYWRPKFEYKHKEEIKMDISDGHKCGYLGQ